VRDCVLGCLRVAPEGAEAAAGGLAGRREDGTLWPLPRQKPAHTTHNSVTLVAGLCGTGLGQAW